MKLNVFLSPVIVDELYFTGKTTVVIDVLRATSTIATAINNGAKEVVPVASVEFAVKVSGGMFGGQTLLGGERNTKKIEGFALGNSPFEYAKEVIEGKWGNGEDRKTKLQAAGYDYNTVQKKVNELLKTSKTTKYKVINVKSFLNVRTGPSVNYASVGKYYNGDIVEVETITKGWAKIVNKYPRYVSVNYLSKLS